ncbi:hypothetical protein FRB96_006821 [Tulasnella sp. 330]|nr:hypothetical protein FRB96_006821 [Tulasnella sp. 330]KAG8870366.1 hypothetical protein FRB97_009828 [Tulasnella sp. 331]
MFLPTSRHRVPTEERELLPINHSYGHGRCPSTETTNNGSGVAHVLSLSSNNNRSTTQPPLSPPPSTSARRTPTLLNTNNAHTIHVPPPPPRRRETTSVHDAALADLNTRLYGPGRGRVKGGARLNHDVNATSEPPTIAASATSYGGPFPRDFDEPIFDPFSGAQVGVMKGSRVGKKVSDGGVEIVGEEKRGREEGGGDPPEPHSPTQSEGSPASSPSSSSSSSSDAHSDTWAALAKIRTIQSEVARTHLKSLVHDQEKIDGRSSGRRGSVGSTSRERASASRSGVGREGKTDNGDKSAQDAFAGRREAIDEIVRKLEDLSSAVKHLHNLPAPSFTFLDTHSHGNSSPREEIERPTFGRTTNTLGPPNRAHSLPMVPGSPASSSISSTYPHTSTFSSPLLSMSTTSPPTRYVNTFSYASQQQPQLSSPITNSPASVARSPRPSRNHTLPPPVSHKSTQQQGSAHPGSTFTFPARSATHSPTHSPTLSRNASAVGSKGHLPPIWDSPEDLVKSPRVQQTFNTTSTAIKGDNGSRGVTKRTSAPRSMV